MWSWRTERGHKNSAVSALTVLLPVGNTHRNAVSTVVYLKKKHFSSLCQKEKSHHIRSIDTSCNSSVHAFNNAEKQLLKCRCLICQSRLQSDSCFCEIKRCLHYRLFKEMLQERGNMIWCEFGIWCKIFSVFVNFRALLSFIFSDFFFCYGFRVFLRERVCIVWECV